MHSPGIPSPFVDTLSLVQTVRLFGGGVIRSSKQGGIGACCELTTVWKKGYQAAQLSRPHSLLLKEIL